MRLRGQKYDRQQERRQEYKDRVLREFREGEETRQKRGLLRGHASF